MSPANNSLSYREAILEDAAILQNLIQDAFRASDSRSNWTGDATKFLNDTFTISTEAIEGAITAENSVFIIGSIHNERVSDSEPPAGTSQVDYANSSGEPTKDIIACFNLVRKTSDSASIAWFTIAPRYQQGGLGRRLLAYAESYAIQKWPDVKRLELNALSSRDALIQWYERNGYVKTGKVIGFPTGRLTEEEKSNLDGVGFVYMEKIVSQAD